MTIVGNGTSSSSGSTSSSPSSYSYTESYSTIYVSSTTYKVSITETVSSTQNIVTTVWLHKDGTAVAINISGQNLTGSSAQSLLVGVFAGFTLQIQADSLISFYTATSYFHSTGTSNVNIGSTKVSVTNYVANSLPTTYNDCTGGSTTLTSYSFSVGTPQGSSSPLVTYEHFAGSDTSNGQTSNFNYVLQVTAITVA